jgi:tetratricopeptide (TPR) repeat protein
MSNTAYDNNDLALESTVEPVRRPAAAGSAAAATAAGSSGLGRKLLIGAAVVACAVGLVAVFVYLPARVADSESASQAVATEVVPAEPETPELSEGEVAALTDEAESLLAQLLEQQQALENRSVQSWGDTTFSAYQTAGRAADDAFLAEDLPEAVRQYHAALDMGAELLARSDQILADALAAGDAAIAGGDAELAARQFAVALGVDPDNAAALHGQQRASVLSDVLAAVNRAESLMDDGQYAEAVTAYRSALAIDRDFAAARKGLARAETQAANAEFEGVLAQGFAALDRERFDAAVEQFEAALAMRPDSDAAGNGLERAIEGQEQGAIAMAEIRARAFELREAWDEAIERYREALATDPTLKFAIEGLARAQRRADLDTKLEALISSPQMLLTDSVLADARGLLAEAQAIDNAGPRLSMQVERLDELVELASTPIGITLVSDNLTEVAVFRVGEIGAFESTELKLRPGTYTATGRRRGYRDVRETFTVLPGTDNGPVTVICVEPIDVGSRGR